MQCVVFCNIFFLLLSEDELVTWRPQNFARKIQLKKYSQCKTLVEHKNNNYHDAYDYIGTRGKLTFVKDGRSYRRRTKLQYDEKL